MLQRSENTHLSQALTENPRKKLQNLRTISKWIHFRYFSFIPHQFYRFRKWVFFRRIPTCFNVCSSWRGINFSYFQTKIVSVSTFMRLRDLYENGNTYVNVFHVFWVKPVKHVATASIKMVVPKEAWIGTNAVLHAAVAPSQHNSTKKLKNPNTNWKNKLHFRKSFVWKYTVTALSRIIATAYTRAFTFQYLGRDAVNTIIRCFSFSTLYT